MHVVIDRPEGSLHPKGGFRYELNYGYVPGMISPDGEEPDAYVLGPDVPVRQYDGEVVAVVLRADDVEDTLVVSQSSEWARDAIEAAINFQERFFASTVVTDEAPNRRT
jgi:inorganic pyrophosphatase